MLIRKIRQSNDCNGVSFKIAKYPFDVLNEPLKYMFETTLRNGVLSNNLKTVSVASLSKCGNFKMSPSICQCLLFLVFLGFYISISNYQQMFDSKQ